MTKEEYTRLECKAYNDYQQALKEINIKYCLENNPYKVGDIIKDHIGYARIKRIIPATHKIFGEQTPCCQYECDNLTTKLEISKREPIRIVYQGNIISE